MESNTESKINNNFDELFNDKYCSLISGYKELRSKLENQHEIINFMKHKIIELEKKLFSQQNKILHLESTIQKKMIILIILNILIIFKLCIYI